MPVLGHRNSPSPARPMERIALPDGSLSPRGGASPRSGAAGSLAVANRPRCKHGARGSVQAALSKANDGDSKVNAVVDTMNEDFDKGPHSDGETAPLKSPRTGTVVDEGKAKVMQEVHQLLDTLSPFADFDEAWGGI